MQHGSKGVNRRVYFLSGFDPRGASFYYRLFAAELHSYSERVGHAFELSRRRGQRDPLVSSWQVTDRHCGWDEPLLEVCFLHWDDIARNNWPRNPLRLLWDGVGIYGWYLLGGGFTRISRWAPTVALCGLWPLLFFSFWVALSAGLAIIVSQWVTTWFALGVLMPIGLIGWRVAEMQGVIWLYRSIRFTHNLGRSRDLELRKRLVELAERIMSIEQDTPAKSAELVGHSSGSFVMAMLAATLLRHPEASRVEKRLSLLSLGQNLANLAIHKGAIAFHDDLKTLATVPRLPWRDITSRDDYLCFAGVDPYLSCSLFIESPTYPRLDLIKLAQRLKIKNWWGLINNQFALHFEYLHTAPKSMQGGFDYFEHLLGEKP